MGKIPSDKIVAQIHKTLEFNYYKLNDAIEDEDLKNIYRSIKNLICELENCADYYEIDLYPQN